MKRINNLHESKSEIIEVKRLENIPIVLNSSKSDYNNGNYVQKEISKVVTSKKFKLPRFKSIFRRKRAANNEVIEPQPIIQIQASNSFSNAKQSLMIENNKLQLQIEQQQEIINKLNTQNISMYNLFEVGTSTKHLAKQNKSIISIVILLTTLLIITIVLLVPMLVIKMEELTSIIGKLRVNASLSLK
jgi:hypothetical protein